MNSPQTPRKTEERKAFETMQDEDLPQLRLSSRVEAIPEALSVYMNNLIYRLRRGGEHVCTLSLGEAYFDLPFFGFEKEDIASGYHYSESMGIPSLRERVARYYSERYGAPVDSEREILVSAGSKPLIYMALQSILEPGDEVLVHEPAWLSYPEQIKLAGGGARLHPLRRGSSRLRALLNGQDPRHHHQQPQQPRRRGLP